MVLFYYVLLLSADVLACYIVFFNLKGKIQDNNACSMMGFILLKTSDDLKCVKLNTSYILLQTDPQ